jgi:hypothetical protein
MKVAGHYSESSFFIDTIHLGVLPVGYSNTSRVIFRPGIFPERLHLLVPM